jgi:hypothetical protein
MIHAATNTKGGAGKSLLAYHLLCSEAHRNGKDFDLYELDEKNLTTEVFGKSKILEGRGQTLRPSETVRAIGEAIYKSVCEGKEIIIDIGGGIDTDIVLDALIQSGETIRFYVPTLGKALELVNIRETYDLIQKAGGEPNLVITKCLGWDKVSCGAVDIFGSQIEEVETAHDILEQTKAIYYIPDSKHFAHAERDNELLGDFIVQGSIPVEIAKQKIMEWVKRESMETGESGMNLFAKRWGQWQEIKKAYEYYQRIAQQNIFGL